MKRAIIAFLLSMIVIVFHVIELPPGMFGAICGMVTLVAYAQGERDGERKR